MFILFYFFQKSSVAYKPPCECFNTGFQHCVLYPKEFCNCSASCTFVSEYLQGNNDDETEMISMRTYSGLITPLPPDVAMQPEEIEEANVNSAKLLNSQLQVLFGVDFFPLDQADAEHSTNSEEEDEVGIGFLKFPALFFIHFLISTISKLMLQKKHLQNPLLHISTNTNSKNAHCK